jgi:hypothetical protein
MGVGVTHASFGGEVQSELSQVVRIIRFFRLAPGAQPQEPEGEEARHLVEALGGGHQVGIRWIHRSHWTQAERGAGVIR